jgi:hypothetical protein
VRLVVIHSAEGARDRTSLGKYFQGNVNASSHVGIDAGGIEQYVPYDEMAWTLLNGNPVSDNAELCAFARWTREQWLSEGTVDGVVNPKRVLDNAAAWIRERCQARGVPIRKLTPAQVDQGLGGVIGHADWTYSSVGQGDHTDPGVNFPWDYVMARAAGGQESEDDVSFKDTTVNAWGGQVTYETIMQMLDFRAWENGQKLDALTKLVGELAKDPALTPERAEEIVRAAVAGENDKALARQQAQLDATLAVVREVVGERDENLANEVVEALGQRLSVQSNGDAQS